MCRETDIFTNTRYIFTYYYVRIRASDTKLSSIGTIIILCTRVHAFYTHALLINRLRISIYIYIYTRLTRTDLIYVLLGNCLPRLWKER